MAIEQKLITPAELREQLLFGRDQIPDLEETVAVIEAINALKMEKNAVVLGHWYMRDAVKLVADYLGDSLRDEKPEITIPEQTRARAYKALGRMLERG